MVDDHKQRSVQWKYWIAVLKVNITAKVNISITQYGDTSL